MDADELEAPGRTDASPGGARSGLAGELGELIATVYWERHKDVHFERLALIEAAVRALGDGRLDEQLKQTAESEAHKMAGSVGLFGFAHGAALARQIYELLGSDEPALPGLADRLGDLAYSLRVELERPVPGDSQGRL